MDEASGGSTLITDPGRVLVVGGSGMLGSDVVRRFSDRGWYVNSPSQVDFDITSAQHLERLRKRDFGEFAWIVNCAAYTAVDQAESDAMAAMKLNFVAPGVLASVCQEAGWRYLHVSTDFVFDGTKGSAYTETDQTNPLGVYGKSKLQGEQAVAKECPGAVIVRTSWLYGPNGKSFPRTMIEAWKAEKPLRVVADQWGTPTYTWDLADALALIVLKGVPGGLYHAAGPDRMNWHDLAVQAITAYAQVGGDTRPIEVAAITTADWPTPAQRPFDSSLSCEKLIEQGLAPMRHTTEALADFCKRLG
ncbi:MAG: dTDP-4-dehydrorhamnose reductase [Armatimonadetes bacterium]|nr:dTDP-4-dehydrorhamnose reductase [Armatimonadota bacterium]